MMAVWLSEPGQWERLVEPGPAIAKGRVSPDSSKEPGLASSLALGGLCWGSHLSDFLCIFCSSTSNPRYIWSSHTLWRYDKPLQLLKILFCLTFLYQVDWILSQDLGRLYTRKTGEHNRGILHQLCGRKKRRKGSLTYSTFKWSQISDIHQERERGVLNAPHLSAGPNPFCLNSKLP